MKAKAGMGRCDTPWVSALHSGLISEFDRLCRLALKFNYSILRLLALLLTEQSENEAHCASTVRPGTEVLMKDKICMRWVQSFCERFQVLHWCLTRS